MTAKATEARQAAASAAARPTKVTRGLRIAQLAPPWFPIPPVGYGGIELVVHDLANGLHALGHQVYLLAPGDSRTDARLIPNVARHLGLDFSLEEKAAIMARTSAESYRRARAQLHADVLHDHTDERPDPDYPVPIVRTIHGPALPEVVRKYAALSTQGDAFVAISRRQRELYVARCRELFGPGEHIHFVGTIHNPLDTAAIPFQEQKEDFAFFVGRADWEKNPAGAIRIARATGLPLVMALRINTVERPYFEEAVRPLLGPDVTLLGEITPEEKFDYLKRAKVVIFSSQWEEPFGLVMTEAMACGTPVVALARGAAPEVIVDGVTGFLRDTEEELADAIRDLGALDSRVCRRHVEDLFNPRTIADQYLAAYGLALERHR
ncbi:MAG TPA: glycosyltransferase family 4 protein [Thermomicrobiales bacterium]|nr:glycosyltransferase family 4 protein [Thermomicrobiales bacterium]